MLLGRTCPLIENTAQQLQISCEIESAMMDSIVCHSMCCRRGGEGSSREVEGRGGVGWKEFYGKLLKIPGGSLHYNQQTINITALLVTYVSADLGMCGMRELYSGLRRLGISGLERMEKTTSEWEYMNHNMTLGSVCFIQYVVLVLM